MRSALAREDLFTVVIDCFPTDTASYADIVLPAASFLEFDDISTSYFHLIVGAQVKCAEPMGESLPNQGIFRRLARAMGFRDPSLLRGDRELIDDALAEIGLGVSWEELKDRFMATALLRGSRLFMATALLRGSRSGWVRGSGEPLILWHERAFPTPSGKVEIASARAEADGHPRLPQACADPRPSGQRLRLLSPAGKWPMNSSYGNDPRIRELMGAPRVVVHPRDARARGIGDGQRVVLANAAGSLAMVAAISDMVPAGVLLTDKSRWPAMNGGSNVNLLHIPKKTDMGESTSVHAVEVTLAPA